MVSTALTITNQHQNTVKNVCIDLPDGIFIENEKGCEYFLYCRNNQAIEGFCPVGMWFNFDSGVCDKPKNVHCQINHSNSDPMQDTDEQDETIKCPSKDSGNLYFVASKVNCSRYFICYHGRAIRQQCMNNLHWNMAEKKCDYPKTANCKVCVNKAVGNEKKK